MDVSLYAQPVNFCDRSAEIGLIFRGEGQCVSLYIFFMAFVKTSRDFQVDHYNK